MSNTKEQIVNAIKNAGIIGAGGGGFPAYVKWQANVDTVIVNASECEPLLSSDRMMMTLKPELLIDGLKLAMRTTNAKQGIIGIKKHYTDAVSKLNMVLPKDNSIKLHFLENYYPAGDEFLLVYETTKRIVPEGGIPLNVNVVVNNAITLMQAAEAIHGKPVTERTVTLAGEFNEPKIVSVPIGTIYKDLIQLAGGLKQKNVELIDGGPMMGKIVNDWSQGIAKTTSGLLALPKNHFIVRMAKKSIGQIVKQSKSACCQCFRCSDLCPRNLLGHEIFPHLTMRAIDYNQAEPTQHITSAYLCSQCGLCELIACDFMLLSPRKIYAEYRKKLVERGVKNPHGRKLNATHSQLENRKVSIPMVMKKLNLNQYDKKLSFKKIETINHVRIPITKHIGAPAIPKVHLNQKVKLCEKIAETKEGLGAVYHASIAGVITEINNEFIEIK